MAKLRRGQCAAAAVCLLIGLLFTACERIETTPYEIPENLEQIASGTVAQNERYTLEWDAPAGCVLLRDRATDHVWSTIPYDFYLTGDYNIDMLSPLYIEYYDLNTASLQMAYGYDCIEEEQFSSVADGQGLRLTLYFSEAEITITVTYTLRADSLEVGFTTSDFSEYGSNRLISVSLSPYLCAAANTRERSHYLFVPAGSGALMYTDDDPRGVSRDFSGEVYGTDPSRFTLDYPGEEEPVRLPVFGAKAGENALCAIIENGDGAASINASAGHAADGYSNAYTTFYVRGFANIEWGTGVVHSGVELYTDTILLHNALQKDKKFSVGYYPLTGASADYNGMAACYRRYLEAAGLLRKSEQKQQAYHVTLIGGTQIKAFILGVPYTPLIPLTTFEQSQQILKELQELTGKKPEVLLQGFGASGMDAGQIAGGFAFANACGAADTQRALEHYCKEQDISLFTDFDAVYFNKSGKGFGLRSSCATAANTETVASFPLKRNVRVEDTEKPAVYLLRRSKLSQVIDKLCTFGKGRISGMALSTLGRVAYSDHQDIEYTLKSGLAEQLHDTLDTLHKAGHPVLLGAANAYAAGLADSLYDVPLQNGGYHSLDETVPFYEMVYRNKVPLYSTAINLSPSAEELLLRTVEAGVSPSFTLSYSLSETLADADESLYYGVLYESNKPALVKAVNGVCAFLATVEDAGIRSHTIVREGLTRTEFDNGVTVLVNHSDAEIILDGQAIPARSFRY